MNSLSESQKEEVLNRSLDVERIAREYIVEVIKKSTGFKLGVSSLSEGISPRLNEGIFSHETMYKGPTDMAVLYAGMYVESVTLPRES